MTTTDAAATAGAAQTVESGYVVLIDAGGKQDFIFASNKQAANVGASELIRAVGEVWVPEAVEAVGGDRELWQIIYASGKAVVRVPDREIGRQIISAVTIRALREAPGLLVCGVIVPFAKGGLGTAVIAAHREHKKVRAKLPPVESRTPNLPYVQPCQYSGLPATEMKRETERLQPDGALMRKVPRARSIHAAWKAGVDGRDRMAGDLEADRAVLETERLDQGVENAGWIAVVHADGNGIGRLFQQLQTKYSDDEAFRLAYQALSTGLAETAKLALRAAIGKKEPRENWILPIVVGGDDVTVIMDGRVAFDVTRTFLDEFEKLSRQDAKLDRVLSDLRQDGLTAAAGIVFVKPHHPFSDAYALAEELCESAKTLKAVDRARGMLDFHVLHDSIARQLSDLRAEQIGKDKEADEKELVELRRWGGPYLLSDSDEQRERNIERLREAMIGQQPSGDQGPTLSTGAVLRMRDALVAGGEQINRERDRVIAWAKNSDAAEDYLKAHLRVDPAPVRGGKGPVDMRFTRLIDALHLLDMAHGTTAEENVSREEPSA